MNFKDLEIGMKVKVISGSDFHPKSIGKVGRIIQLDDGSPLDVKVSFDDQNDDTDWGNSIALVPVDSETTQPLDQLMDDLVKQMDKALNGLDFVSLDTLSRIYQRIKSVSNQTN